MIISGVSSLPAISRTLDAFGDFRALAGEWEGWRSDWGDESFFWLVVSLAICGVSCVALCQESPSRASLGVAGCGFLWMGDSSGASRPLGVVPERGLKFMVTGIAGWIRVFRNASGTNLGKTAITCKLHTGVQHGGVANPAWPAGEVRI